MRRVALIISLVFGLAGCGAGPIAADDGDKGESAGDGDGDGESDTDPDPVPDAAGDGDGDGDVGGEHPNEGDYLLALHTTLGPDLPLLFIATLELEPTDDPLSWVGDISLQSLSVQFGSSVPGDPVGPPTSVSGFAVIDGQFEIDLGAVEIVGEANPVTGSDITVDIELIGELVTADAFCGEVIGQLTAPLDFDLNGSTFAAIAVEDTAPESLPSQFPWSCEQIP